jgi:hypothetical protein
VSYADVINELRKDHLNTYYQASAWERTLDFLKKLSDVRKKAERVVERIGQDMAQRMKKFIRTARKTLPLQD